MLEPIIGASQRRADVVSLCFNVEDGGERGSWEEAALLVRGFGPLGDNS